MNPKFTRIISVLPTAQWVVVEITGPDVRDICTKVVDTWKVPQKVLKQALDEAN